MYEVASEHNILSVLSDHDQLKGFLYIMSLQRCAQSAVGLCVLLFEPFTNVKKTHKADCAKVLKLPLSGPRAAVVTM